MSWKRMPRKAQSETPHPARPCAALMARHTTTQAPLEAVADADHNLDRRHEAVVTKKPIRKTTEMKTIPITTTARTRKCLGHAIAKLRALAVTELDRRTVAELERIRQEIQH